MPEFKPSAPLLSSAALVLSLCVAASCGRGAGVDNAAVEQGALRIVVERPQPAPGEQTMVLPGTVEPWEMAELYARVTGYLGEVNVDIGDVVEEGAVLARIVVPAMTATIKRASADLASARAELTREQAQRDLARITRERLAALRARERGAVSQQDVDAAGARERAARARIGVARSEVDAAAAELARLETLGGFAEIDAPYPGRITRRVQQPGALVREGTTPGAQPVVEIARTDRMRLAFMAPETAVRHLSVGDDVQIRLDAFPGETIEASIARLAGALDPATRSMRIEIDLANDDGRLSPGMYASLTLTVRSNDPGKSIVSRAVRGRGAERYVLVAQEGTLERRDVTVALDDGRRAVIAAGLGADDLVMIAGSPLAVEGSAVAVVENAEQ